MLNNITKDKAMDENKETNSFKNITPGGDKKDDGINKNSPSSTRDSIQLPRRFFHMSAGICVGAIYQAFLTRQMAVSFLGIAACIMYLIEQIRINYPEYSGNINILNKHFLRAEEQLRESAAIPYCMAILLTIISFPKSIALVAIYTLAIGDPMSALVGIKYGKHKLIKKKSLEGSLAFFISSFIITFLIFRPMNPDLLGMTLGLSFLMAFLITCFELIPLRLDDNLTIPLAAATILWLLTAFFNISYTYGPGL